MEGVGYLYTLTGVLDDVSAGGSEKIRTIVFYLCSIF